VIVYPATPFACRSAKLVVLSEYAAATRQLTQQRVRYLGCPATHCVRLRYRFFCWALPLYTEKAHDASGTGQCADLQSCTFNEPIPAARSERKKEVSSQHDGRCRRVRGLHSLKLRKLFVETASFSVHDVDEFDPSYLPSLWKLLLSGCHSVLQNMRNGCKEEVQQFR
jgi:hypothetical protein